MLKTLTFWQNISFMIYIYNYNLQHTAFTVCTWHSFYLYNSIITGTRVFPSRSTFGVSNKCFSKIWFSLKIGFHLQPDIIFHNRIETTKQNMNQWSDLWKFFKNLQKSSELLIKKFNSTSISMYFRYLTICLYFSV